MSTDFKKISIDGSIYMHYNMTVVDGSNSELVYTSIVANDTLLKNIGKLINRKKVSASLQGHGYCNTVGPYQVEKEKQPNDDYAHMIIKKKDKIEKNQDGTNENYTFYIMYRNHEELKSILFDKIYANTSVPVEEVWMDYIYDSLDDSSMVRNLRLFHHYESHEIPFNMCKIFFSRNYLINTIRNGLREMIITIDGSVRTSETMNECTGLDQYLNVFGDILANKIQESFVPKYTPGNPYDDYVNNYDDSCYYGGIQLYEAQKAVIQSAVRNMDKNKSTFVIGEMGTGKTAMGSGMVYSHYRSKAGSSSVIMCPGHLVEKWKREVEKFVPNAKGVIVENINDLIRIEDDIRNKYKKHHLFVIMSKETAKFSYEQRPVAVWSSSRRGYVCPDCGKPLTKTVFYGKGKDKYKVDVPLDINEFQKPNQFNQVCSNKVRYFDSETLTYKEKECGSKLWGPVNRFDTNIKWVKLGKEGWMYRRHFQNIYDDYFSRRETLNKKEQAYLLTLIEANDQLATTGSIKSSTNGVRKYSIARYMRERLKGKVDYLLLDEVHELKGRSLQGDAMGDLAMCAKKVICLTGTLLNGYADGLFYLLYRTMPQVMKAEGFEYSDESAFQRFYGVVKRTNEYKKKRNGDVGDRIKSGSEKRLPGVSPLTFTKFLLENAVFVSISDMAEGLPGYTEIPIGVDMDNDLKENYKQLEKDLRSVCSWGGEGGMKTMGALLQTLSTYPDMPYDCESVLHPDTGEIMCTPRELNKGLRNKENALIDLIKEKKAAGEKVLVYYEWTNKTDVADKITKALEEQGLSVFNLTSRVKAKEREERVEREIEKGIDVMLCNPNLVKTGLDLLDFTTIVFYQMGYNIFTMRQASRRSWRLSQTRDIEVYFMYYKETIQEQAIGLMASKLQASMALEGKFSEEGLRAMADNEDLLSKIASSVVEGIKHTVDAEVFTNKIDLNNRTITNNNREERERRELSELLIQVFVRQELDYLVREAVKNRQTATNKLINKLFNSKVNLGSLYKAYA